jgi:hypothetical protein
MPIEYDEFGFIIDGTEHFYEDTDGPAPAREVEVFEPIVPIRHNFPEEGSRYLGGNSNGWEYRTMFAGGRLEASYAMVVVFLKEHGYGDIPIPETADDLKRFRKQRTPQLQLFPERGYVHNPIKILFEPKMRNALVLCLYNEAYPQHLLKFHGVVV